MFTQKVTFIASCMINLKILIIALNVEYFVLFLISFSLTSNGRKTNFFKILHLCYEYVVRIPYFILQTIMYIYAQHPRRTVSVKYQGFLTLTETMIDVVKPFNMCGP